MARIFRPQYTRSIPPNSEPCQIEGQPAVRWKGRRGKWVYGILCAKPGRCRVETGKYRLEYRDHEYHKVSAKGYTDKSASEHLLATLATRSVRIHSGQLPPEAAKPRLTLTELLERWARYIHDNGATATGAAREHQRARDVCEGIQAVRVSDLTPARVLEWVGERRKADRHKRRGFSTLTASNYIGSVKGFTRWCAVVERCEAIDHLSGLKRRREETSAKRPRRALSEVELRQFLKSVREVDAERFGLTAYERWALYLFACSTGLRAVELHALTPAQISLSRREVVVERGAKNRRRDVLPVPPPAIRAVKPLLRGKEPLWPNRGRPSRAWWLVGAEMIAADLEAAGLPVVDGGRVFDFHSLRSQYATDLDRAGVSLQRAQRLMRHSDPKLTAKFYTRPDAAEMAEEVGKLKRGRL